MVEKYFTDINPLDKNEGLKFSSLQFLPNIIGIFMAFRKFHQKTNVNWCLCKNLEIGLNYLKLISKIKQK